MNADYNDPDVQHFSRERQERERQDNRREARIQEDSKWIICDCCLQVNCICGCKEVMMNSRDY